MLIDLKQLFDVEGEALKVDYELDLSGWELGQMCPLKTPVAVRGEIRNRAGVVTLRYTAEFVYDGVCDRCLEPVVTVFDLNISRITKGNVTDESEVESEDLDEANYIDGYTLDVDQLVGSEILIGWPTKILCSEDCKGICNVCGQNLNQGTCNCEDTSLDPRMSVIRDVFKNFKEV